MFQLHPGGLSLNRPKGKILRKTSMNNSTDQPVPGLTQAQGNALVALARNTLMEKFNRKIIQDAKKKLDVQLEDKAFNVTSGTFVTLKIGGKLRGCIGSLVGREPLTSGVRSNAVNAAFHDPRFRPLTNRELDRVSIEVSVLSEPQPLVYNDAADLITQLRTQIDGVTIRQGGASATFLPQVWKQLPDVEEFLSHLCTKAGLSADRWRRGDLDVETYQVQCFTEPK
jgi:AmmeMemoRadiSam system protein A